MQEFLLRCSFLELYNEEIRDLLSSDPERKLELRENPDKGVFVQDLTYVVVDTGETMDRVMTEGNRHRHVGATAMNAVSSRSHSIFTVIIEASENKLRQSTRMGTSLVACSIAPRTVSALACV